VLARELLQCVGAGGSVVGLDANESMLAVARRECPGIQWCQGASESIPFPSDSFDGVACQFGLMFFNDRRQSILEMARVLRPQRKLVVAVWGELHTSPGYAAMAQLLQRLFGRQAADALRLPFELGDLPTLTSLFADNQLRDLRVLTQTGAARFPSIQAWVTTEVKGWVLADMLDEAQFRRLQAEAEECLESFAAADGRVEFPVTIHIATAVKERRR
jgi:SAM-dependent methyltransferase